MVYLTAGIKNVMQPIRRWSKGNAEKFNVLVNCFVSANLGVVMDPGVHILSCGRRKMDLIHQEQRTTVELGQESHCRKVGW